MSEISAYITTFNCARTPIDINHFAANLFNSLTTNLPPDLVVLSLQEIAPIGYSFLGGSWLDPYLARFRSAIDLAAGKRFEGEHGGDDGYEEVIRRSAGMTGIMVFARREVRSRIKVVGTAGVGVGVWEMGNKGAVGVRLSISDGSGNDEETWVTFVAAHLAPMEDAWQRRAKDWQAICEGLVFQQDDTIQHQKTTTEAENEPLLNGEDHKEQNTLFTPPTHLFFAGDLNYRTSDSNPGQTDWKIWPQPSQPFSDFSSFLVADQLTRERKKGKTLHHLSEAEINFVPTYKYSNSAQKHAASSTNTDISLKEDESAWAKHRTPSWCDRILYSILPKIHTYTSLPLQPTSDHRPVVLSVSIPSQPVKVADNVEPPFAIRSDWREARIAARRYELVVGMAAHLSLTWEGEALVVGSVVGVLGGYLVLRAMLGV